MCKPLKFFIENGKNIVFLICAFATVIAFCVTLYGIPPRIDEAEKAILTLKQKQEMFDLKFNTIEQEFATMREDLKEIRSDIKILLRTQTR